MFIFDIQFALLLVIFMLIPPIAIVITRRRLVAEAGQVNRNRRRALFTIAGVPLLAALATCTTSTVNGITTLTLNLVSVTAWAMAIQNGITLVLGNAAISALLGSAKVAIIQAAVADLVQAVGALSTAYQGQTTLSFTTTSVPAAVGAFQADCTTILGSLNTVAGSLGGSIAGSVISAVEALQTILSLGAAVVATTAGLASAPYTPMSETQALAVLGVKPN